MVDAAAGRTGRGEFARGLRDIAPVIAAASPFGMVFGTLAAERGLSFDQIMLMTAGVYAGASQFVALDLWATPLPFWTIVLAVLAVNFRHILYSASIGRLMGRFSPVHKALAFFVLVDPQWALSEKRAETAGAVPPAYYWGVASLLYPAWVASTAVGALFGRLIDDPAALGLDFLLPAYFTILLMGFRDRPNAGPIIAASGAAALLAYLVLGSPWHIGAGATTGVGLAALLAHRRMKA